MAQALVEYNYDAVEPDELTIRKGDVIADISYSKESKGWWQGTLTKTGKRGMFPDNFVKLISDPDGIAASQQTSTTRKCRVLFHYKPSVEDELELQVGDIIDVISEVEEGWWKGKLKDKIGMFPSNFVEETTNRTQEAETREASRRKQKISQDDNGKSTTVETVTTSVTHSAGGVQEQTSSSTTHTVISATSMTNDSSPTGELPLLPPKPVKEMCKVIYNYEAANPDELSLHEGDVITLLTREGQDPGWWKGEHKGKVGLFPDNFVQIITVSEETSPVPKPDRPSKVLTTSKSKESINKVMTSSMGNIASISRKYSDNVKPDEKQIHPMLSKKPVLPPPPLKKPQRSSSDLAKSPTAPNLHSPKNVDTSPTLSVKPGSATTTTTIRSGASNLDNITVNATSATTSKRTIVEKSSDSLDGGLFSKSGSYSFSTESSYSQSSSVVNNTSSTVITSIGGGENESELDLVSRAAMLTHPTASRVKAPKRRPPSTIYSGTEPNDGEEDSDEIQAPLTTSASSSTVTTMLNGDKANKVPWLEKLKLCQAKKSMQVGNKTRVMIGGTESTSSTVTTSVSSTNISNTGSSSPEAPKAPNITGVTLRSHQPSYSSSTTVTPRPQSMVGSLRTTLVSPNDSTITVPAKQWNELLDKVARLEKQFESQIGSLTEAVKELSAKLDKEERRGAMMQQNIDLWSSKDKGNSLPQ